MNKILFATTNAEKFLIAQTVCGQHGIDVEQVIIEIDEIQGENPVPIIEDKVRRAYEKLGQPVIVSDDSWSIPALGGFPGAYMKSVNHWFKPEDFIRLMDGVEDRTIILHQYLAYYDGETTTVFNSDLQGKIVHEPRGYNAKSPNMMVIELEGDNGRTIAETFDLGAKGMLERYTTRRDAWHEFVEWYTRR